MTSAKERISASVNFRVTTNVSPTVNPWMVLIRIFDMIFRNLVGFEWEEIYLKAEAGSIDNRYCVFFTALTRLSLSKAAFLFIPGSYVWSFVSQAMCLMQSRTRSSGLNVNSWQDMRVA